MEQVNSYTIINSIKDFFSYCISKWKLIFLVVFVSAIIGIVVIWLKKPKYEAVLTFALEESGSGDLGGYANLAAQLGLSMGSGGGGAFKGDNLIELLKSRKILDKTLLSEVEVNGKKQLLVNYYLDFTGKGSGYYKKGLIPSHFFSNNRETFTRTQDSILFVCQREISKDILSVNRVDKKLSIVSVSVLASDALFGTEFCKVLVKNLTDFYVETVTRKQARNVAILENQADSLKALMTGSLVQMAVSNDLNVNPLRQMQKTTSQRKQIDVQVYTAAYGEILKNLELARITLLRDTPLIQIIDEPALPLENRKKGRMYGAIMGFLLSSILLFPFLMFLYKYKNDKKKLIEP